MRQPLHVALAVGVSALAGALLSQSAIAGPDCSSASDDCAVRITDEQTDLLIKRIERSLSAQSAGKRILDRFKGVEPGNAALPMDVAPKGSTASIRSSRGHWHTYLRGRDKRALEEVRALALQDLALPSLPLRRNLDVWSETTVEGLSDDASRNGMRGAVGFDYAVNRAFLLGATAELEGGEEQLSGSAERDARGNAFLVGPYVGLRLGNRLSLDASAGWGRGQTSIGPGAFGLETQRRMLSTRIRTTWDVYDWLLTPTASLSFAEENPVGAADNVVAKQRFSVGPELRKRMRIGEGEVLEPFIAYRSQVQSSTAWDDIDIDRVLSGGVSITKSQEYRVDATAEIGDGDGDPSLSSRLKVTVPLD